MHKLTVLVSIYKAGDWLENRLDNLYRSTAINDMEIWVVNADSPDPRDDEIPQKFPAKYIKLPERIGVYETWNYIIANSDGVYLTNANADDLIAPHGYQHLMATLDNRPDIAFAYPSWYTTSTPNLKWEQVGGSAAPDGRPGNYTGDLNVAGVGHFPMWRRSLHKKYGLFDGRFKALGDADWWARCRFAGNEQFQWVNDFLGCYLWRNGENLWNQSITGEEWALYHQKVGHYKQGLLE